MSTVVRPGGELQKFRMKEPVQAFRYEGPTPWIISTSDSDMIAHPGDWILIGVKGGVYPCKPDIFAAAYEAIND